MNSNEVTSKSKIVKGNVKGEPKTITKTRKTDDGKMIVEVTTIFEVADPDQVFSINGEGITMTLESSN